ncbi:DMT family transporter [Tabrizicola sp.]|uniref:DMT family transporter n=1 Tax=Tabrizicola sp. TaxID=2005166 RepID=UPI003F315505
MTLSATHRGILALTMGIAIFSVQDVILKQLSGDYPLHQAMVLRSLTALPFHLAIVWWFDGRLSTITTPNWRKMLARGLPSFVAYTAYYLGLAYVPMADAVALFFTSPLFITLAAVIFMSERVSLLTTVALAGGFAGVLLIVKPGAASFDLAALLPILGAFGYAMTMVIARSLGRTESAAAMAFWGNVCFLLCALALSALYGSGAYAGASHPSLAFLTRGWVMPDATDLALMVSCGVIAAVGITLLTYAYRIAPSSSVAPFEYSFMFWGVLWGWTIWGDFPDILGWVGIAIIIGAGLLVISAPQNEKAAPEGAA